MDDAMLGMSMQNAGLTGPAVPGPLAGPPGRRIMTPAEQASAVSQPTWWQNLGRPNMTPSQQAAAIHKPNWYRNL
jgi:hypothetical protein